MFFKEIIDIVSGATRELSFGESNNAAGDDTRFFERLAFSSDFVMIKALEGEESVFEFSVILSTRTRRLALSYRRCFINY
jgi:hypothetical protein